MPARIRARDPFYARIKRHRVPELHPVRSSAIKRANHSLPPAPMAPTSFSAESPSSFPVVRRRRDCATMYIPRIFPRSFFFFSFSTLLARCFFSIGRGGGRARGAHRSSFRPVRLRSAQEYLPSVPCCNRSGAAIRLDRAKSFTSGNIHGATRSKPDSATDESSCKRNRTLTWP